MWKIIRKISSIGQVFFKSNSIFARLRVLNTGRFEFLRYYRIDLYIGPASVDWTSLTASKETGLEDVMLGVEVWLENMNESQYK